MNYPKVTIIIINWNGLTDTLECLESVQKNDYPNYEILVVDNASTNNSPEVIRDKFPKVVLLRNKNNLGFAGGNNAGIEYAMKNGAEYVWLLNNDTVVERDTLRKLVETAEEDAMVGTISPFIYYYTQRERIQFCGGYFDYDNFVVTHFAEPVNLDQFKTSDISLWGTAILIKRALIEKVGMLNEDFFAYHEDQEFCYRAIKAGFKNEIIPNARIFHKAHYIETGGKRNFPVHMFYYRTRNHFWLWWNKIKTKHRISFLRRYFSAVMKEVGVCQEMNYYAAAEACLDGLWSAFFNTVGAYDRRRLMPVFLKKILSYHPFFLSDLLKFNVKNILMELKQRILPHKKQALS